MGGVAFEDDFDTIMVQSLNGRNVCVYVGVNVCVRVRVRVCVCACVRARYDVSWLTFCYDIIFIPSNV